MPKRGQDQETKGLFSRYRYARSAVFTQKNFLRFFAE